MVRDNDVELTRLHVISAEQATTHVQVHAITHDRKILYQLMDIWLLLYHWIGATLYPAYNCLVSRRQTLGRTRLPINGSDSVQNTVWWALFFSPSGTFSRSFVFHHADRLLTKDPAPRTTCILLHAKSSQGHKAQHVLEGILSPVF